MASFSLFNPNGNPNAKDSKVVDARTGETAPALPRWERKTFVDYAAPRRIVQQTGTQFGRICPKCGEPAVVGAQEMRVFSLLWVIPVFPLGERDIWGCGRCGKSDQYKYELTAGWRQKRGDGPDPEKQNVPEGERVPLDEEVVRRAAETIKVDDPFQDTESVRKRV